MATLQKVDYLMDEVLKLPQDLLSNWSNLRRIEKDLIQGRSLAKVFRGMPKTAQDFLELRQYCKDYDLPNLFKYLSRRYNVFVNYPKDFERFKGRTYGYNLG